MSQSAHREDLAVCVLPLLPLPIEGTRLNAHVLHQQRQDVSRWNAHENAPSATNVTRRQTWSNLRKKRQTRKTQRVQATKSTTEQHTVLMKYAEEQMYLVRTLTNCHPRAQKDLFEIQPNNLNVSKTSKQCHQQYSRAEQS